MLLFLLYVSTSNAGSMVNQRMITTRKHNVVLSYKLFSIFKYTKSVLINDVIKEMSAVCAVLKAAHKLRTEEMSNRCAVADI